MSTDTCWFCDGDANYLNAYCIEGTEADIRLEPDKKLNRFMLIFDGICEDPYEGISAKFLINYCPICGRRL